MADEEDPAGVEDAVQLRNTCVDNGSTVLTAHNANLTNDQISEEIRSLKMNIACLCTCVVFVTSTTITLLIFSSTLLKDGSLNTASLACVVATEVFGSALVLPHLGTVFSSRKIVTLALVLMYCYTMSYLYPTWATTLPGSILLGLGQSFLASLFMYSCTLGSLYSRLTNGRFDTVMIGLTGIIVSCSGAGLLLGNTALYLVLDPRVTIENSNSKNGSNCDTHYCSCDIKDDEAILSFDDWRYYSTVEVFVTLGIIGVLVSLFAREFPKNSDYIQRSASEYLNIIKGTWSLLNNYRTYMLLTMIVFIGIEEYFLLSGYTQIYMNTTTGTAKVWMAMMLSYGLAHIIASATQWILVRFIGRTQTISLAIILIMACIFTFFLWHPNETKLEVFIVIAGVWGIAHGILVSVVYALFAVQSEGNIDGYFALATFWRCVGHLVSFVGMQFFCLHTNLYILIAVGLIGYLKYFSFEKLIKQEF